MVAKGEPAHGGVDGVGRGVRRDAACLVPGEGRLRGQYGDHLRRMLLEENGERRGPRRGDGAATVPVVHLAGCEADDVDPL